MEEKTVGFAMCGSFCTHARAMAALEQVRARWRNVIPIVSECTAATDTRFGNAHDLMREMERICDHRVIATVKAAEPIGPQKLLDLLILCPCTGNTLGKLAAGVTDSSVTMAAKAHLRNGRPLLIAPSTTDGLSASAAAIGALLLNTMTSALTAIGVDKFWQRAVVGALILVAIVIDRVSTVRRRESLRKKGGASA